MLSVPYELRRINQLEMKVRIMKHEVNEVQKMINLRTAGRSTVQPRAEETT